MAASRFRTAKKGTKEFDRLIRGTFSETERALPIESLRVGTPDEEVTFEIVGKATVKSRLPYLGFLGPQKLLFVLFPVFYFVMLTWNDPSFQSPELECLIMGLVLSVLCVQIKVDVHDFVSGYDRIRGIKGQRVLRQGLRTVAQLEKDFKVFAAVAVFISLIPLIARFERLIPLLVTLGLFYFGYKKGVDKSNRLIRDLALAVIAGPTLAYWVLPEVSSLPFGLVWGILVFFVLQIENFQYYLALTQAHEKNLLTLKSFDHAPTTLWALWALCIMVYAAVRLMQSHIIWFGGSILILIVLSFQWRKSLLKLLSPAGSEIEKIAKAGHQLFYVFIALWIIELLFKALIAPSVLSWFN